MELLGFGFVQPRKDAETTTDDWRSFLVRLVSKRASDFSSLVRYFVR